MHEKAPIFIHAWWRSSSTYVWSKLRQNESLRCYYEPLNERIAALKPNVIKASSEVGISLFLRHPVQRVNYFAEYLDLITSDNLRYSPDLSYTRYLLRPDETDSGLQTYLNGLISDASCAGRRAVLCFCRSQMRSAWIKQNIGGIQVAQIRNPFDQWASFQVTPYFVQKMVNVALGLRATYPFAFAHIEQFERQANILSSQSPSPSEHGMAFTLNRRDALGLFLVIWIASALQAVACCDYLLDVDRLSTDGRYQRESSDWFRTLGCMVDFADCATPTASESQSNSHMFDRMVEKAVDAIRSEASCLVIANTEAVAERLPFLSASSRRVLERALGGNRSVEASLGRSVAYFKRGVELAGLKRFDEALASYDRALAVNPNNTNAHFNRGKALLRLRRLNESLASFDRAIALKPDYAGAYLSRGIVLSDLTRLEESLASFDRAVAVKPDYFAAYVNRALVLIYLKRFDEALASYDRAIALKPDDPEAYWRKSDLKLLLGDYEEGWRLHEWRWKSRSYEGFSREFPRPLWLGEQSVIGKTLLIHAEAALGDTIQFCRYIPMVQGRGAKVLLEVHPPLAALMSTLNGDFTVVEKGRPLPDFDLHCPMMSLPLAFKATVETIPAAVPYLRADSDKRKSWRDRLGDKTRPRIGVAWSGRIGRAIDRNPCRKRYFELRLLESLLQLPMEFHSLQKDIRQEDAKVLRSFRQIRAHHDELNDFADAAALIEEMDLVISVDTAVAHLAGALVKPVWILLPHATDYRWMIDRDDSPWYPSATLFRQSAIGDWSEVISRVIERLKIYFDLQPAANFGAIGVESTRDAI
jgi:tetratricopeptide (TPR) repeat protein